MELHLHLDGEIHIHVDSAELSKEDEKILDAVLRHSAAIARKLERLDARTKAESK